MQATLIAPTEPLHFPAPPIVEAVIGIDVEPMTESALEAIERAAPFMAELGYGPPEPISEVKLQMRIEGGKAPETVHTEQRVGSRFMSLDSLFSAQFSLNGFLFSRLGSYDSWEQFRGEATKAWAVYQKTVGLTQVTAYGVRYINKVFIPFGRRLEDYLQVYGHTPDALSGPASESVLRMAFPISDPEGQVLHQQILLPTERDGFATMLLDNDFRFSGIGLRPEDTWDRLEKIRVIKNNFFINVITKKTQETFV